MSHLSAYKLATQRTANNANQRRFPIRSVSRTLYQGARRDSRGGWEQHKIMSIILRRFVIRLFVWGLLVEATVAYGQVVPRTSSSHYGTITGTVRDSATGEPIHNASIALDSSVQLMVGSDTGGNYLISKVPLGKHSLRASYIGYDAVMRYGVEVAANETTRVDIYFKDQDAKWADQARSDLANGFVRIWFAGLGVSPTPDSAFTEKYGFAPVVLGCNSFGSDAYNAVVIKYLEKRNGQGWYQRFWDDWDAYLKEHGHK
ncbi:MAG TPA: carboxypeptidase-like regulatory domain-containing protein [Candidatus Acidoferrales bacterium]|nr:carboxypeptidase-like regulatory domain-containing protein [Candidatus Acidoferrales bacterium]